MKIKIRRFVTISLAITAFPAFTVVAQGGSGGGGGGGETTAANNLSFPVIAADAFVITPVAKLLRVAYSGSYAGLSAEQLAIAQGDIWYAQKVTGNTWQADYDHDTGAAPVAVWGVDWGDNVESVNPTIGTPFRLEIVLYAELAEKMNGYTMAVLANPSSSSEVQGTNGELYASTYATVVSSKPKIVVQYIQGYNTASLAWDGTKYTSTTGTPPITSLSFGPELNVAGKYIFGASSGGWKPNQAGYYRITFYLPGSKISLADAIVGNYADWANGTSPGETGSAATPRIDSVNNLSYVDVLVKGKGGKK
jgi:hypothetical protein